MEDQVDQESLIIQLRNAFLQQNLGNFMDTVIILLPYIFNIQETFDLYLLPGLLRKGKLHFR